MIWKIVIEFAQWSDEEKMVFFRWDSQFSHFLAQFFLPRIESFSGFSIPSQRIRGFFQPGKTPIPE